MYAVHLEYVSQSRFSTGFDGVAIRLYFMGAFYVKNISVILIFISRVNSSVGILSFSEYSVHANVVIGRLVVHLTVWVIK